MRLLHGKWFVAIRFSNDLCVGVGKPSVELASQADRGRKLRNV